MGFLNSTIHVQSLWYAQADRAQVTVLNHNRPLLTTAGERWDFPVCLEYVFTNPEESGMWSVCLWNKNVYFQVVDSHTKPLEDVDVPLSHSDQAESVRENVLTQNQNLLGVCCPLVVDPNSTVHDHLIPAQKGTMTIN